MRAGAMALAVVALASAAAAQPHHGRGPDHGEPHHPHGPPPGVTAPWQRQGYVSTYRPLPRNDVVIVHATVLDGRGGRIEDGSVLVRDGRIAAVGKGPLAASGAQVIDASGRWLTPGVIDVHSHDGTYVVPLTSIDDKSSDVSELSSPDVADTWIETAINPQDVAFPRALAGGVTALQVLPGSTPVFGGRSVVLKTITRPTVAEMMFPDAPRGFKMACGENPKSHDAEVGRGPTSRQGEVAFIREEFGAARHYEDEWNDYLSGHEHEAPKDDARMDALVAILHGDLRLHVHCYRADEMAAFVALSHELGFRITAFHHAVEAYKIPEILRREDICAAVWPDWWGFKMEAMDGIRANAAFLDAAGDCVTMHSDSPQTGQWLQVEAAKAMGAGRHAGVDIPPERAIAWLTSNPARVLGLSDRIGSIAPGLNADLVIWSGDPFSIYSHPDQVFVDGALAYDRHDPTRQPKSDFEVGREAAASR